MNPVVKATWLAALRSNDYKQGRDGLVQARSDGCFHCGLGVLCDLAVKAGVIRPPKKISFDNFLMFDGASASIPVAVRVWAGLSSSNPLVPYGPDGRDTYLADLNDGHRLTFHELADVIETHL